jgi:hypothetical protein
MNDLRIFDPARQDYTIEPGGYDLLTGPDSATPLLTAHIEVK